MLLTVAFDVLTELLKCIVYIIKGVINLFFYNLEGSPLMWMILLHLHVNLNAADDDEIYAWVLIRVARKAAFR